jgi:hypothetical protein
MCRLWQVCRASLDCLSFAISVVQELQGIDYFGFLLGDTAQWLAVKH